MKIEILYQTGMGDRKANPGLDFELFASFSPPEFMNIAFICLYGGREEIVVAGDSEDSLLNWWKEKGLDRHPRLVKMEIKKCS